MQMTLQTKNVKKFNAKINNQQSQQLSHKITVGVTGGVGQYRGREERKHYCGII